MLVQNLSVNQIHQKHVWFYLLLLVLLLSIVPSSIAQENKEQGPQQYLAEGLDLHKRGIWSEAALSLTRASQLFEQVGDTNKHVIALLTLSQSLDNLGRSYQALETLERAKPLANTLTNPELSIRIHNTSGNIWLRVGETEKAKTHLQEAFALAKQVHHQRLIASIHNDLGTLNVHQRNYEKAEEQFATSLSMARDKQLHPLMIASGMNLARIQQQQGRHEEAKKVIDSITLEIPNSPDTSFKAFAYLNAGTMYTELLNPAIPTSLPFTTGIYASSRSSDRKRGVYSRPSNQENITQQASPELKKNSNEWKEKIQQAYQTLQASRNLAHKLKDVRTESFAVGFLGHLYEMEGRSEEGLILTREAIRLTQASSNIDSLYQWHWQTARLNAALGKQEEALKAYEHARLTLIPVRRALFAASTIGQRPFRERQGALFFEHADQLLQKALETQEDEDKQSILAATRTVIEDFKSAELQDYFQDTCVEAALEGTTPFSSASLPNTAIIYPIILPERLEILVSIGGKIQQVIQEVSEEQLRGQVRSFLNDVQSGTRTTYQTSSQALYHSLIDPIRTALEKQSINTLIIVPDGSLRTIPFAALYDGETFLIEKYAIAYTPGLNLTGLRTQDHEDFKVLGVGLTEAVNNFSPLPYVKQEIEDVQAYFGGTTLLDQEFNVAQFKEELSKGNYNIVHLATHASFKSTDNGTFIQTGDEQITMDQLAEMIGVLKYGAQAPELITFSACETALGDDQAALGLAGSAIKAGAKSALASLWRIDDEATATLIPEFYRHLKTDTHGNKATALRNAQLK